MIDITEITIKEFENEIYDEYVKLFPEEEQREWEIIEKSYEIGVEKFYKITLENKIIGFFMLELIDENHPYYLDYFAIYSEYQNKGYGTMAIKKLTGGAAAENGLIGEIEKIKEDDTKTIKRFEFYKRLGFRKVDIEYLLYNVLYNPIVYIKKEMNKEEINEIFMDYYKINVGEEAFKKYCKIIKD